MSTAALLERPWQRQVVPRGSAPQSIGSLRLRSTAAARQMLPAGSDSTRRWFDWQFRQLPALRTRNAQTEADVKRQGQIHVWELLLSVQIHRLGDYPPAVNVGVNVPHVVAHVQDILRVHLLNELHLQVADWRHRNRFGHK